MPSGAGTEDPIQIIDADRWLASTSKVSLVKKFICSDCTKIRFEDFLPVDACVLLDHNLRLKEEINVRINIMVDSFVLSG